MNSVLGHLVQKILDVSSADSLRLLKHPLDRIVRQLGTSKNCYRPRAWHGFQQVFQELPCSLAISLADQLRDRELAGGVNADEQVQLAFGAASTSAISMWKSRCAPSQVAGGESAGEREIRIAGRSTLWRTS